MTSSINEVFKKIEDLKPLNTEDIRILIQQCDCEKSEDENLTYDRFKILSTVEITQQIILKNDENSVTLVREKIIDLTDDEPFIDIPFSYKDLVPFEAEDDDGNSLENFQIVEIYFNPLFNTIDLNHYINLRDKTLKEKNLHLYDWQKLYLKLLPSSAKVFSCQDNYVDYCSYYDLAERLHRDEAINIHWRKQCYVATTDKFIVYSDSGSPFIKDKIFWEAGTKEEIIEKWVESVIDSEEDRDDGLPLSIYRDLENIVNELVIDDLCYDEVDSLYSKSAVLEKIIISYDSYEKGQVPTLPKLSSEEPAYETILKPQDKDVPKDDKYHLWSSKDSVGYNRMLEISDFTDIKYYCCLEDIVNFIIKDKDTNCIGDVRCMHKLFVQLLNAIIKSKHIVSKYKK